MGDGLNRQGNSRRWIRYEVEQSLRRLGTDYIDLYQIHRPDPTVDVDETLSVLTDLLHEGKIRTIGCSTFPAEHIVEAQWVARTAATNGSAANSRPTRSSREASSAPVLPTCQRYGMGVIVWSPLTGGWLTGRFRRDVGVDMTTGRARRLPQRFDPSRPGNAAKLAAVEELIKIAADAGCSLIHLALAFVIANPAVTSAIIGPRTMEQLTDLLAGADVALDDDVLDRIDQIVPPGVTLNAPDGGWQPPALTDPTARRRPRAARAAS